MDRRERAFWNRVRPCLSTKVFVRRIENAVMSGEPDVFLLKNGEAIWIELKYAEVPVRASSKLLGKGAIRVDQVNWHLEYAWKGGTSYILIGTDEFDYLLPGKLAAELNDMPMHEIEASALCAVRSIGNKLEEAIFK